MAKTETAPATDVADAQIDWSSPLEATVVATLKPSRTADSIPEPIRTVADQSFTSGDNLRVTLPNGVAAKSFVKHLRDYAYLCEPRRTARATVQPDGVSVAFKVSEYVAPAPKEAAAA